MLNIDIRTIGRRVGVGGLVKLRRGRALSASAADHGDSLGEWLSWISWSHWIVLPFVKAGRMAFQLITIWLSLAMFPGARLDCPAPWRRRLLLLLLPMHANDSALWNNNNYYFFHQTFFQTAKRQKLLWHCWHRFLVSLQISSVFFL